MRSAYSILDFASLLDQHGMDLSDFIEATLGPNRPHIELRANVSFTHHLFAIAARL